MRLLIRILIVFNIVLFADGCKKDSPQSSPPKLSISNLVYAPDTVAIIGSGTVTYHFQGTIDFKNAAGGVAEVRLTTSTGSDLTVAVSANTDSSGTLAGIFDVVFPATATGNFTFQIWIIDHAGNISNKLQGSVKAVVDDGGTSWINANSTWALFRVIWANQRFIAVGDQGTIVTSTDPAHSWNLRYSESGAALRGVVWSGTQYIVVGGSDKILSSPDGNTWTSRFPNLPGSDVFLSSVAWSGQGFVAAGYEYTNPGLKTAIFNSPDGINWTVNADSIANGYFANVIWANNQFIAVGYVQDSILIFTSPDGLSWVNRTYINGFGKGSLYDIVWTGSQYVAVGVAGPYPNITGLVATSPDGITWNFNTNISWQPTAITWSGHTLMATTSLGEFYSSTDGLAWSKASAAVQGSRLSSISWSGFQYVAVGDPPATVMLVSPY